MSLLGVVLAVTPSPDPSASVDPCTQPADPFGPLPVECYPPAPSWLLPVTLTATGVVVAIVAVLLVMWNVARRRQAAAMRERMRGRWVDLNEFDPRRDKRRPRSPKVVRDDDGRAKPGRSPDEDS